MNGEEHRVGEQTLDIARQRRAAVIGVALLCSVATSCSRVNVEVTTADGGPILTDVQLLIAGGVLALMVVVVIVSLSKRSQRRRAAQQRAGARADYQASIMAPAAWQEPGTGSWGAGSPASGDVGAPIADPSAVTFDPGTGRPLRDSGLAAQTLADSLATEATPLMAPAASVPSPSPAQWAPPSAEQVVDPQAAVAVGASAPAEQPTAGWYPDPLGDAQTRWWSGEEWTEHTA